MNFGTHLREAREKRGVSLRQIATSTRISLSTLEALENNEIKKLPGGIFSRAFVRSYAQEIGLDPDEAVREFVHQFPLEHVTAGTKSANDRVVASGEEGVRRRQQQFSLAVTLAILIPDRRARRLLRHLQPPLERRRWIGRGREQGGERDAARPVRPLTAHCPRAQPSPSSTASCRVVAARASAVKPAAAPGALAIAANEPLRLRIAPSGPCWVRVSVDGVIRHQALMQKGEVYQQEAKDGFDILIGDAGTFRYSINDRPGRITGESGDVIVARINRGTLQNWLEPAR